MKGGPYYFTEPTRIGEPLHIRGTKQVALCGLTAPGAAGMEVSRDLLSAACQRCVFAFAALSRPVRITRPRRAKEPSRWEVLFDQEVARSGLPEPRKEYQFFKEHGRLWAFDRAWLIRRVAVEIDGGHWLKGAKAHGGGFALEDEAVKYACASLLGWRVFRVTPNLIRQGYAVRWVEAALAEQPGSAWPWKALAPAPSELRPKAVRSARIR